MPEQCSAPPSPSRARRADRPERREARPHPSTAAPAPQDLDPGGAQRFLESSQRNADPLYAAYVLSLVLGLRRGEVPGLAWEDVDLVAARYASDASRSASNARSSGDRRRRPAPTLYCRSRRSASTRFGQHRTLAATGVSKQELRRHRSPHGEHPMYWQASVRTAPSRRIRVCHSRRTRSHAVDSVTAGISLIRCPALALVNLCRDA
jgi:hypothetical protein